MQTSLMRKGNARAFMQYLIDSKVPFDMTCSNYTITVEAGEIARKFVAVMQTNRTFAAFSKIKSNVKAIEPPIIKREDIVYFVHDFKKNAFYSNVINIDLKSCYATVLFNDGMITEDTFNYLSKCNKQERLASVGMLASKKKKFKFNSGEIYDFDETVSPTSPFFFYAVKRTYEIMSELRAIIGQSYLFTWVDGIYFSDPSKAKACEDYLTSIGFRYTTEELKDFDLKVLEHKIMLVFQKYNDKKGCFSPKAFNLPSLTTEFKSLTLNAIMHLNYKNKNYETSKSKISCKVGRHPGE